MTNSVSLSKMFVLGNSYCFGFLNHIHALIYNIQTEKYSVISVVPDEFSLIKMPCNKHLKTSPFWSLPVSPVGITILSYNNIVLSVFLLLYILNHIVYNLLCLPVFIQCWDLSCLLFSVIAFYCVCCLILWLWGYVTVGSSSYCWWVFRLGSVCS